MAKVEDRISFFEQIRKNKIKSVLLIVIIFAVFLLLGWIISLIYNPGEFFFIMIIAIVFSISYILLTYYNSDKIALASVSAKEASQEEFRQLHNLVEGICLASGMPKPRIYVMKSEQINAFATGRDPGHSIICVTTGSLKKLSKQELEGVIAHELGHIANYDIRFMTLVAVMVGMIAIISQIFLRSLWFRSGGGNRDNKAGAVLVVIGIVLAILAPIVVQIVQFAVSRKREYVADASSVKFVRSPTGLIGALKKIKNDSEVQKVSGAVAPLFISDPFKKKVSGLFQTHPSLESRIQILERM